MVNSILNAMTGFQTDITSVVKSLNAITVTYGTVSNSLKNFRSEDELGANVSKVFGNVGVCSALIEKMQNNLNILRGELELLGTENLEQPESKRKQTLHHLSIALKALTVILAGAAFIALCTGVGIAVGGALGAAATLAGATSQLVGRLKDSELSPLLSSYLLGFTDTFIAK